MKPKNRIMCPDCGRPKMLFETERKAQDFLRWNADDIHGGCQMRPYYCKACCGWHLTHVNHKEEYDTRMDERIEAYRGSKFGQGWNRRIEKLKETSNSGGEKRQKYRKIHNPKFI